MLRMLVASLAVIFLQTLSFSLPCTTNLHKKFYSRPGIFCFSGRGLLGQEFWFLLERYAELSTHGVDNFLLKL